MFKPLLRTLPTLSGNVKLNCKLSDYKKIDDDTATCSIKAAQLMPLTHELYKRRIDVNLLNGSYEFDLPKFYKLYSNYFYDAQFAVNKTDLTMLDLSDIVYNRNLDFEFGCKRISYQRTNNQYTFFAPIYCESADDIPDYFLIKIELTNAYYTATKYIKIRIGEENKTNYLSKYLNRYYSKIDNNVIHCLPSSNAANYKGINVVTGGFVEALDSKFGALYNKQNTINNFDAIICGGFKRNKIVIRQVIPLAFSFDVNDVLDVLNNVMNDQFRFSPMKISGFYYVNDDAIMPYDFNIDYTKFNEEIYQLNENNGVMEYIVGNSNNIMDIGFPSLNEARYIKYQYSNKLTANYCRWKMKYSDDEHPYIINMSAAFSMNQGSYSRYKEYPIRFSSLNALVNVLEYNNVKKYNLIYPLGTTKKFYTDNYYNATPNRYLNIYNNYCLNWYNITSSKYDIFADFDWKDTEDNKVYFKGILYNFENIYNNYSECPKIDKFNVFVNVNSEFKTSEYIKNNFVFSNYTIFRQGNSYNNSYNCRIPDKFLLETTYNLFMDEGRSRYYTDTMKTNQIFTYHTPELTTYSYSYDYVVDNIYSYTYSYSYNYYSRGNYINLVDYDIDFYERNKYYNYSEILNLVHTNYKGLYKLFNNYAYSYSFTGYVQLPIYTLESLMPNGNELILNSYSYSIYLDDVKNNLYYTSKSSPSNKVKLYDTSYYKFRTSNDKYNNELYFTTLYDKDTLIKAEDIHKINLAFNCKIKRFDVEKLVNDYEDTINTYIYLPIAMHNKNIYANDIFQKVDRLNKFYGDIIPNSQVANDDNVLYVDPYNIRNILGFTNNKIDENNNNLNNINNIINNSSEEYINNISYYNSYLTYILSDYHVLLNNDNYDTYTYNTNILQANSYAYNYNTYVTTYNSKCITKYRLGYLDYNTSNYKNYENYFTYYNNIIYDDAVSKILYAKFFNYSHIKYYYDTLYKNYDLSNEGIENPLNNIYIKTKCLSTDNGHLQVNDIYRHVYVDVEELVNEYSEDINNEYYETSGNEYKGKEYIEKIEEYKNSIKYTSIVDSFNDLYEHIRYDVDKELFYFNDYRFETYGYFELYFKKLFIKLDKQLWELINIEGKYKDLYIYRAYEPYEYDKNVHNYIDFKINLNEYYNDAYEIENIDSALKPVFNNLYLQYKEDTTIYAEYHLDNINEIHSKDYNYTFYRYNKNNMLVMYDISRIKKFEDYKEINFDKTYDLYDYVGVNTYTTNYCFDNLNICKVNVPNYSYNYSYYYTKKYAYQVAYVLSYSYVVSNTLVTESNGQSDEYVENNAYTYSYSYNGHLSTYYYNHLNQEVYPTISYYDICKYINYDIIPNYGYTYAGAYTSKEFNISKTLLSYSYSYYGYYMFNINIDNTMNTFNMLDLEGNSIKQVQYINGHPIFNNDMDITKSFNFIIPFTNINIYSLLNNINTIYVPGRYVINNEYIQANIENNLININKSKSLNSDVTLFRYFDNIVPWITQKQFITNSHDIKYKSIKKTILDTGKYTNTGDSAIECRDINIYKYPGIYNLLSKPSNGFSDISYEYVTSYEYKHFEDNKYYNLEPVINIKIEKKLYYSKLLELENEENTYAAFRDYIKIASRDYITDDEILFLYKKYKVEYDSVSIGLNTNLTQKVYSLTYKFSLL